MNVISKLTSLLGPIRPIRPVSPTIYPFYRVAIASTKVLRACLFETHSVSLTDSWWYGGRQLLKWFLKLIHFSTKEQLFWTVRKEQGRPLRKCEKNEHCGCFFCHNEVNDIQQPSALFDIVIKASWRLSGQTFCDGQHWDKRRNWARD